MIAQAPKHPLSKELELDTRILADLIYELNIARRHLTSYPKGHPLVNTAIAKVTGLLSEAFALSGELNLGIAKDVLMVGSEFLDRDNPVFRDFAASLFNHGVVMLTLVKGLRPEELASFNEIIARKREDVTGQGGFGRLLEEAGVSSIRVQTIDYRLFRVREGEQWLPVKDGIGERRAEALWQSFVSGLSEGTLNPSGSPDVAAARMDPELVAALLNERSLAAEEGEAESYERTITQYMRKLDREEILRNTELMERLGRLVRSLNSEMRRHFLNGSFRALADRKEIAETVLRKFPDEAIIEALEQGVAGDTYVPPFILGILQKLSAGKAPMTVTPGRDVPEILSHGEIVSKLGLIFREDELDEFVPPDYRKDLDRAASAETVKAPTVFEAEAMKDTLSSHQTEVHLANIVVELVSAAEAEETAGELTKTLREQCTYFLQVGDFPTLLDIHRRLRICADDPTQEPARRCRELLGIFAEPEFVEGVFEGPRIWGKAKYAEIGWLISDMGEACIDPLLDRLEIEESLSVRRFYVDQLIDLGPAVRDRAVARLGTHRWYFARNLLVILRNVGDSSVLPHVSSLVDHPHPKVRQELVKTLIHLGDPAGDRLLLQDLRSPEPERRFAAVTIAGKSRSPEVLGHLLGLLSAGGLTGNDLEFKKAAIQTLAEIGNAAAVPALEALLRSRNLFYSVALLDVKAEVLKSMHRYPPSAVEGILREMAGNAQPKIAAQAAETLRSLRWGER